MSWRELQSLTRSGLLELRQDGRRTYYKARTDSPVFADLRQLFARTAGIVPLLQSEIARLPKITWAFLYGSIARGEEDAQSDVDLMIIGSIATARLLPMLRRLEQRVNREVNLTRYSEHEFYATSPNWGPFPHVGSERATTDVERILSEAKAFSELVDRWIRTNYPSLV